MMRRPSGSSEVGGEGVSGVQHRGFWRFRPERVRLISALSLTAGMACSTALVLHSSYATFSAQTSAPPFNLSTGTVTLTNDSAGSAAVNLSNQRPGGPTFTKCINVTSTGSAPSAVNFYTSVTGDPTLPTYVNVAITAGTANSTCSTFSAGKTLFSGTLQGLSAYQNYGNGLSTGWGPTGSGSETRAYQFVLGIATAAPNSTQGTSTSATFTWEAQNT
jgi:hypothetical protein